MLYSISQKINIFIIITNTFFNIKREKLFKNLNLLIFQLNKQDDKQITINTRQ